MDDSLKTINKKNSDNSIKLLIGDKTRYFDIDDPVLPDWIADNALSSGGYPYPHRMPQDEYKDALEKLQIELVKMQYWLQDTRNRVISIFEGRDAAGKGGTIFTLREYMNPRTARDVALPKPTETEAGQWYFQRYVAHFPTFAEFVTFDRSWYNRAGVERVMGFCTPKQLETFMIEVLDLEKMIVTDGIYFFKFWLDIGQEMQLKRFHERRHSPLRNWKFSPMDVAGITRWNEYTEACKDMIKKTHTDYAPWTIIRSNDKRRARLAAIRRVLLTIPYTDRDLAVIGAEDPLIIGKGTEFLVPSS